MDYAKALNTALGVADTPEIAKQKPSKSTRDSAAKPVSVRQAIQHTEVASAPFDLATWVPNPNLTLALQMYPGSTLDVNPDNGAVCFNFNNKPH